MTKFLDGPAAGKTLMLKNSPVLLRVTEANGNFDALDRHTDEPRFDEVLTLYRLKEHTGNCHLRFGGNKKHMSGFYPVSTYELHPEQPPEEVMRDPKLWAEWHDHHMPV